MAADEALESVAAWAADNVDLLNIPGDDIHVKRIKRDTYAVPLEMLQSGAEIHSINLSLFYEVNV